MERPRTIRINGDHVDEQIDTDAEEYGEEDYDEEIDEEADEEADVDQPSTIPMDANDAASEDLIDEEEDVPDTASVAPKPHFPIKKPAADPIKSERDEVMSQLDLAANIQSDIDYEMPSMDMLIEGDSVPFESQKLEALDKAKILEKTCKEFGYKVQVVEVETGPVI